MFHFPDRLYNRNHVINRISSFIHDFKDDLAAFSPVYRMITVIVNKANSVENVKADSVRDVYIGKITKWQDAK